MHAKHGADRLTHRRRRRRFPAIPRLAAPTARASVRTSVLVVDDDPDTLYLWAVSLRAAGYVVATAVDGVGGYDVAVASLPALVVLDLDLPGRSGHEVAAMLRHNPKTRRIPLIAATGFSQESQLERARRAGFDVILIKPCSPTVLIAQIERLVALAAVSQHQHTDHR